MQTLKHIDVWSAAKVAAVLNLIIAIILAVILAVFGGIFTAVFGSTNPLAAHMLGRVFVILPIIAFLGGLIFTIIEAALYNFVANRIGGIKIQFKGAELQIIEPWSTAKMFAIGGAVLGVIAGVVAIIATAAFGLGGAGVGVGIVVFVVLIVILAIGGLVFGAITAVVYNFLAEKIGGVKFYIKNKEFRGIGVLSYVKMEAILGVIAGLIEGIIFISVHSATPSSSPPLVATLGLATIIAYPIIYLVISAVSAAIDGALYNWIAGKIGGVKLLIS